MFGSELDTVAQVVGGALAVMYWLMTETGRILTIVLGKEIKIKECNRLTAYKGSNIEILNWECLQFFFVVFNRECSW